MALDPSTDIGKIRLRVADYSDLPFLPDSVYQITLDDNSGSLTKSATVIARYILGMLAHKTHRKMGQLEVWGREAFLSYKEFLVMTISNPAFMDLSPLPYSTTTEGAVSPLLQFQQDWNRNYYSGTESQQLANSAINSPNLGNTYE